MGGFFSSLFNEMGARRRRLRASLGDRGQALAEFLVLGGLLVGSLGLYARTWMAAAAPWGFTLPFVFIAGFFLIEVRRQRALRDYLARFPAINAAADAQELGGILTEIRSDPDSNEQDLADAEADFLTGARARQQARLSSVEATIASFGYDWAVLLWSFGCALAGAAAFVIAWSAAPPAPPQENIWTPPENSVPVEISP